MNLDPLLPLLALLTSLLTAVIIFFLREEAHRTRTACNLAGAVLKLVVIGVMLWGVFHGHRYEFRLPLLPGLDLVLQADALAMLFAVLSAALWLVTTIYAIGYLEGSPNRSRFFAFFSLCVAATMGISLAGNLLTFFIFYESLTVATYPLVVHRGTARALRAGTVYLFYTLGGGAVLLIGVVWLHILRGPLDFIPGGILGPVAAGEREVLRAIFILLVCGLGVKAALVPLHGWLPLAMVAPAPVSALLHAVAVVKAGAFGIVRVVYNIYGVGPVSELGVGLPLAVAASITIVYGSVLALRQDELKRRLAYSTVSQLSYIALGVAVVGPLSTIGGLVHLVHQGIMKITLFLCAGNLAETLGIHHLHEMGGVGRRMPWTMAAFTVAAFGMIGLPPTAGFISKWYLGLGALEAGEPWVLAILAASTLLNAVYFLPPLKAAWFGKPEGGRAQKQRAGRLEAGWMLLLPPLLTALATLAAGLLAGSPFSPLQWAGLIAEREYTP